MELVERIARVIAGYRLSANADGFESSAASSVNLDWSRHQDEAVAIRDCQKFRVRAGG